jgi:hypothetical protein
LQRGVPGESAIAVTRRHDVLQSLTPLHLIQQRLNRRRERPLQR